MQVPNIWPGRENRLLKAPAVQNELIRELIFGNTAIRLKKFKALGIINDSKSTGLIPMANRDGDIAKKVIEQGGDAVILLNESSRIAGVTTQSSGNVSKSGAYSGSGYTTVRNKDETRWAVIKYE